jgi:hypothetical protein
VGLLTAFVLTILILFLGFIAVNVGVALAFRAAPHLFAAPDELMRNKYLERFEGELKKYANDWFALQDGDWEAFAAEYRRGSANAYAYDPFCEFKHPARNGRFINISANGFRAGADQGAWPPEKAFINIFFFGASNLFGVGPDWASIPSYLQETLNKHAWRKQVRLYNFGRGAYFSSLDKVLFFKMLSDGIVPDLALFLGGANEAFYHHGLPATHTIFTKAIDDMNRELVAEARYRDDARPKWRLLEDFIASLPLFYVWSLWQQKQKDERPQAAPQPAPALTDADTDRIIDRWLANRRQIEAVCCAYGCRSAFIWQPAPAYNYDLSHHVALAYHGSLHGHERAGPFYERMRSRLGDNYNRGDLIWLADIQEGRHEPIYLDTVHYTAGFCRVIAEKIAAELIARQMIDDTGLDAG